MSLIDFIEKLQQKPRHVRLKIMWVGSVLGAIAIFAFWLWSLSALLAGPAKDQNSQAFADLREIKEEMPGLWQSLSAGISEVIGTVKEELSSSPTPTPEPGINYSAERLPIEQ